MTVLKIHTNTHIPKTSTQMAPSGTNNNSIGWYPFENSSIVSAFHPLGEDESQNSKMETIQRNNSSSDVIYAAVEKHNNASLPNSKYINIYDESVQTINRTVHMIWISNKKNIPGYVKDNLDSWKKNNPKWSIVLWDKDLVRNTFDALFVDLIETIPVYSWKGNILRYKILLEYGGLYVDTDVVNFKPIESIVQVAEQKYAGAFSVCEKLMSSSYNSSDLFMDADECALLCNAVIGSRKNHPAVKLALFTSIENTMKHINITKYTTAISGPPVWTSSSRKFNIGVLKTKSFYPCMWNEKLNCVAERFMKESDIFAMHEWKSSWW